MTDETTIASIDRIYMRDLRARRIADSAVAIAMQDHGSIDPERAAQAAHDIAKTAAALVVSRVYEEDAGIAALRMERDHYRKLAEESLMLSPMRPFILETKPRL